MKALIRRLPITVIACFIYACVFGQTPAYKNYTTADGLPSDIVYSVVQDDDGFIWFSTDKGVSRFDGRHFKNFGVADGLTGNTILKTIPDKNGRLWFLAFNGKLCFYKDGKIHNPDNDSLLKKIVFTASPYLFYENATRYIWIAGPNSKILYRLYSGDSLQIYHIPKAPMGIWENRRGEFMMISRKGVATISDTGYSFHETDVFKTLAGIYCLPGDSVMWALTGEGVIKADLDGNMICMGRPVGYDVNSVQGLHVDNFGNVWLSTLNGMIQFDSNTVSPSHQHSFLTNHSFTTAYKDRDNNFWFSSAGSGVFRIPSLQTEAYDFATGLVENNVAAISFTSDKKLLAGMRSGGLQLINAGVVRPQHESLITDKGGTLIKMLKDRDGNVWILYAFSLYKYDGRNFTLLKDTLSWYKTIYEAHDGTIWIGRGNGLSRISDNKIETVNRVSANRVYAIVEDGKGQLLLGTDHGLFKLINSNIVPYDSGESLLRHSINSLAVTSDSSVWIGTEDEGLLRMHNGSITTYTTKEGLLSLRCMSLYRDGNRLYVLTDKGINTLEIKDEGIRWSSYFINNLFGDCEINQLLKNGPHTLLLATNRGILQVDERDLSFPSSSQPYINSCSVNDVIRQVVQTNELPYSDNNIQIEFGTIDFTPFGNATYRYKLEGLDKDWNYTTSNVVKYAGIPPGDYRFIVTVRQSDGRWLQQKTPLGFHIRAPWWATWWCLLAEAAGIFIVILIIVRWRLGVYKQKLDQQRAFAESELKALRAQINPHFIYNALNSIQDFVLSNQKEDANLYLTKFAMLMRGILSNSRKAKISLAEEIASLRLYLELEALRFNNNFSFRFVIRDIVPENVEIPSMILQPFVENAVLHGLATFEHGGQLQINFSREDNLLVCVIEDNGIGRKKSAEMHEKRRWAHTGSLGMQITEERIALISEYQKERITLEISDLVDDEQRALGTRVTIYFPIE